MSRLATRVVLALAMIATVVLAPVSTEVPTDTAQAADTRFFDAGNIISDGVFFDGLSMDGNAIQAFLNQKGASCSGGEMPCLKNFRQNTVNQAADTMCRGYAGVANESAATIIAKVGASCGINPRVLLVLLQKEQSLVTRTNPTAYAYTNATGFACPDTAPCDPAFSGFVSQVYFAARQFQRYRVEAARYNYKAGRVNSILWHPNTACGRSDVFIANQATAGLYNYTPYRPNQAALNAGSGTGDACSSYGNRNFWNYFTDWFGSTQSPGGSAIYTKYQSLLAGGVNIGAPVSPFYCGLVGGGCYQVFQGGSIYWSPATGAWSISGALQYKWGQVGVEWGTVGYPVTDAWCGIKDGGCFQHFERGSIYYSPASGAQVIKGPLRDKWEALGWENSSLGYPVMDGYCGLVNGGCYQAFQGGTLYWSPASGAQFVTGAIRDRWGALGVEWGSLGYPVSDTMCGLVDGGCWQVFQRATIYWSPTTGARIIVGTIGDRWRSLGSENGALGYPLMDEWCGLSAGGCYQVYEGGTMYWKSTIGARYVTGPIRDTWGALGVEWGPMGYPTSDTVCGLRDSGCAQLFEYGSLYWSAATGGHLVRGAIRDTWGRTGFEGGPLGYPTTDEFCGIRNGGCFQHYAQGSIYFSPATGAHSVSGAIHAAWASAGYEYGWGYPVAEPVAVPGGTTQRFERGTATFTTASGTVTFG